MSIDFIEDFVNGLSSIGPMDTQVSVITFSSSPHVQFNLNAHENRDDLLSAIRSIPYPGGGTNTASGLDTLIDVGFTEEAGARLDSVNVLRLAVVLTDGQSNSFSATLQAAARVHAFEPTILVYAIGIGNFNALEIEAIATSEDFIVELDSFNSNDLQRIQEERTSRICFEGELQTDIFMRNMLYSCETACIL